MHLDAGIGGRGVQVPNPCTIETMHIFILLLDFARVFGIN